MNLDDVTKILLVRSVEEELPALFTPELRLAAIREAGPQTDPAQWLARRADHLLHTKLSGYADLLGIPSVLVRGTLVLLLGAFSLGLLTNLLGPNSRIHVLYNPVAFLLAWNVVAYAAMAYWRLRRPARHEPPSSTAPRGGPRAESSASKASGPGRSRRPVARWSPLRWIVGRTALAAWRQIHVWVANGVNRGQRYGRISKRFVAHWATACRPLLSLAARRLLLLGGVGVTLGAIAGMYVRGLFFEYNVVWRSTFVTEPSGVAVILRVFLGPAALVAGQDLPDVGTARALMAPDGLPAGPWIHLYALSGLLIAVVPRSILAFLVSFRLRRAESRLALALDETYYRECLREPIRLEKQRLEKAIRGHVDAQCVSFSERVAAFITESLYDTRIVPLLVAFRERGGTLADLESSIEKECRLFEDDLSTFVRDAQGDFERSLTAMIEREVGSRIYAETGDVSEQVGRTSTGATRTLGSTVGHGIAGTVAVGVSTAVAVVFGTVSGGFGEVLGASLLVGLLGTTGPAGFAIGAIAGLVAAGGAWWFGRDKVVEKLKQVPLPAKLLRTILWQSRLNRIIADGRERCRTSVKAAVDREFESLGERLFQEIWSRIRPVLARQFPVDTIDDD